MKCYRNFGIFRKISMAKLTTLPNFYLIALKLKNNYEVEVYRNTISHVLVKNGEDRRLFSEKMRRTKIIGLNFVSKIMKEIGAMYLLQMKLLSVFYHQENKDGLHQVIHTREQKQSLKRFMFGEHLALKVS